MIASSFPIEKRSTANAIENTGYYIGSGLASFNVMVIKELGWRGMYKLMGSIGMIFAFFCALIIRKP